MERGAGEGREVVPVPVEEGVWVGEAAPVVTVSLPVLLLLLLPPVGPLEGDRGLFEAPPPPSPLVGRD